MSNNNTPIIVAQVCITLVLVTGLVCAAVAGTSQDKSRQEDTLREERIKACISAYKQTGDMNEYTRVVNECRAKY